MAQSKVTSYYATRKRVHESKILKESDKAETFSKTSDKLKFQDDHVKCEIQVETTVSDKKIKKGSVGPVSDSGERKTKNVTKKTQPKTKKAKPKTNPRTGTGKGGLKGKSSEGDGNSDIRKVFQTQKETTVTIKQGNEEGLLIPKGKPNEVSEVLPGKLVDCANIKQCTDAPRATQTLPATSKQTVKTQKEESAKTSTTEVVHDIATGQSEEPSPPTAAIQTTPRRTAKDSESTVLSKKIKSVTCQDTNLLSSRSPQEKQHLEDLNPLDSGSPQKKARITLASSISSKEGSEVLGTSHRHLDLSTLSPTKLSSPTEQCSKMNVTNLERLKILNSGRLNTLKERLAKFDKSLSAQKEAENNKYKITSVISPGGRNSSQVDARPTDIRRSTPAAYERFHNLAITDAPSLTLPYKYKWLSELFRCTDTVVSMLHNRKEICSFFKLKNSVQEMTKRDFTKKHLGQIKTVFPLAYFYAQEKFRSSSIINPKPGISQYQLVIAPNLKTYRVESNEMVNENVVLPVQNSKANKNQSKNNVNKESSHEQTSTSSSFVQLSPSMLVERKKIFDSYLLRIVQKHHQDFLSRLNPPIIVPFEKLSRWHSRFPLDIVPDIEPSPLPEPIDVPKVHTAMDVLNKIKGTVSEKLEKALQAVADKSSSSSVADKSSSSSDKSKVDAKGIIKSGIFKGISNDLLQRIRAREASKMVQEMTMPPEEKKRKQMMERLPEMVRIIRKKSGSSQEEEKSVSHLAKQLQDCVVHDGNTLFSHITLYLNKDSYFIAARKAAVSMEDATQKVMDSYHSALPQDAIGAEVASYKQHIYKSLRLRETNLHLPWICLASALEDVRAHIQLLAEIFPKWLIVVTISKGVFLKIDKNMDINIMIDSITKK